MKCQEAINLWSSYRDGELDCGFRGEIERHLENCAECRHFFAAQGEFDAALAQALKQGAATKSLWQREEAAVRAAFVKQARRPQSAELPWLAWLWPSPKFCGALAVVWAVLLVVNRLADMGEPASAQREMPASEQRAALLEQQREFRSLLMATDTEKDRPAGRRMGPRSDYQPGPERSPIGRAGTTGEMEDLQAEVV